MKEARLWTGRHCSTPGAGTGGKTLETPADTATGWAAGTVIPESLGDKTMVPKWWCKVFLLFLEGGSKTVVWARARAWLVMGLGHGARALCVLSNIARLSLEREGRASFPRTYWFIMNTKLDEHQVFWTNHVPAHARTLGYCSLLLFHKKSQRLVVEEEGITIQPLNKEKAIFIKAASANLTLMIMLTDKSLYRGCLHIRGGRYEQQLV